MDFVAHWFAANQELVDEIGIDALMGFAAWVVLAGGQVSLGTAGFSAIGAFCATYLAGTERWPVPAAIAAGVAAAAAAGFILGLPLARLGRAQFAIVTLAFGQFVFLALRVPVGWGKATAAGTAAGELHTASIYAALALCAFGLWRLMISRDGRALRAVAQDEEAASGLGIDPARAKHVAVVAGAFIAGLAGALVASSGTGRSWIWPGFDQSFGALATAVIGGSGSIGGPIAGATILSLIHTELRGPTAYRTIADGLLLLGCAVALPGGVWTLFLAIGPRRAMAERRT
jgi:branched-chain amino acid transport system permease protein